MKRFSESQVYYLFSPQKMQVYLIVIKLERVEYRPLKIAWNYLQEEPGRKFPVASFPRNSFWR